MSSARTRAAQAAAVQATSLQATALQATLPQATALQVTPLSPALGVRIAGVDLGRPLAAATWTACERAFVEHHLVSFPGQTLTEEQLLAFSRRLGELEPHVLSQYHHPQHPEVLLLSNEVRDGKAAGLADAGTYWHSDLSYKARPARATVLYGITIPDEGGDTLFANLERAYEDLSADMKHELAGLKAIHNYAYRSNQLAAELRVRQPLTPEQLAATPSVEHPVVRTHPISGRKSLFINPGFTVRFAGMPDAESDALKQRLFDHCLQARYQCRYKWRPGNLLLWDNAAVMHAATTRDLDPYRHRTLWRTTVRGDEPV
jgi:taurine dioxygenase